MCACGMSCCYLQVLLDDSIDISNSVLNGGGGTGINLNKLPRNGSAGCSPVYPFMFPYVNNIFTVRLLL